MAVIAGFTVNAGLFRSLVSAWLSVQDEINWRFGREDLHGIALGMGRAHMIEFSLFPVDYRSEVEKVWVTAPGEMFAKTVRRFKIREDVRVEVRDDNKFYVGPFQVGNVIEEEDVFEDFKVPPAKARYDATLGVATADFKRMVKRAAEEKKRDIIVESKYDNVGIMVKGREATILFFNEESSRVDVKGYEPWVVRVEGDAKSTYSLELFNVIIALGLTDVVNLRFQNMGVIEASYSGSDFWVTFWLAPKLEEPFKRFEELLVKPKAVRKLLWDMRGDDVEQLEKAVRAINAVTRSDTFNVALPLEDLYIYWKEYDKGYLRISKGVFYEWHPLGIRMSGVFSISGFARWIRDVEELSCFLEGEPPESMVFYGKGAKIAPKELKSEELIAEIEVPEVRGVEVFSGPVSILREVMAEAQAAAESFLVFVSSPFEIVVSGRDTVYYRASLPVDAFKSIEEDYVPVNNNYFRGLDGFFTSVPDPYVSIGKDDSSIYLRTEGRLGELRAIIAQADTEVEDAVKAYTEEFLKPPPKPPPEVKPLVPAKEALMRETLRFIGEGKAYEDLLSDWKKYYPDWMEDWLKSALDNLIAEKKIVVTAPGFYAPSVVPVERISEAEFTRICEDALKEWIPWFIDLHKPGFAGELHYAVPELEAEYVARLTPEAVDLKFRDEILKMKKELWDAYQETKAPKLFIEKLPDRVRHFADDLIVKMTKQLFDEAKAKKVERPPPLEEMLRDAEEVMKALPAIPEKFDFERMIESIRNGIRTGRPITDIEIKHLVEWTERLRAKPAPPAAPPPAPPFAPPPKKELTKDEQKSLEDEFKAYLMTELGRLPRDVLAEFRVELRKVLDQPYETALKAILDKAAEIVVRETLRERMPPPPPVRPPPERIVRVGIPEEEVRVPAPPPIELPKAALPEGPFPRRPSSAEKAVLFEAFRRQLANLGIDPAPWHSTFVWRFDWPFKSWQEILNEFNETIDDIRLGRVKIRVPIIPWETFEEAIKHFFAINLYPDVDAIVKALSEYAIFTTRDEVIKTVVESWKVKDDVRIYLLTKEQVAERLGIPVEAIS